MWHVCSGRSVPTFRRNLLFVMNVDLFWRWRYKASWHSDRHSSFLVTQQTVTIWHCTLIHTEYQLSTKHNSSVLNSGYGIFWREVKNMLAKCKYTGKKSCIWNNIPRQSEYDIGIVPSSKHFRGTDCSVFLGFTKSFRKNAGSIP